LKKVNSYLEKVEGKTDKINMEFTRWSQTQTQYPLIEPDTIWGKVDGAYYSLPKGHKLLSGGVLYKYNVDALKAFKELLEFHGIQFIILLIPNPNDIAARILDPNAKDIVDMQSALCTKKLLEAGIEAVYVTDRLLKNHNRYEFMFSYPSDGHPQDTCHSILADIVNERLARYGSQLKRPYASEKLQIIQSDLTYAMARWPSAGDIGNHTRGALIPCRYIYKDGCQIETDPQSQILVIGNSAIQAPMKEHSFIGHLALQAGVSSHEVMISRMGPLMTVPGMILENHHNYLRNKLVCVMPIFRHYLLSAEHFQNVKEINAGLSALSGKEKKLNFKFVPDIVGNEKRSQEIEKFYGKEVLNQSVFLKKNEERIIADFLVPEKFRSKDICLVMDIGLPPESTGQLTINGCPPIFLSNETGKLKSQRIIQLIPSKTINITINGKSLSENVFFFIRSASLYQ